MNPQKITISLLRFFMPFSWILLTAAFMKVQCADIPYSTFNSSRVENPSIPKNGIIPIGSTLHSNETWLSANRTFVLGFFPVADNGSVLGIWYANISTRTVVWMVNRDVRVDSTAYFQLTTSGDFVLYNGRGVIVWQIKASTKSVIEGVFEDTGNLMLKANGTQEPVWESFNFPTDTLLPGQRFTHQSPNLTSWRIAASDPSAGDFTLSMDSGNTLGLYFNVTNNTQTRYWTSDQFSLINYPSRTGVAMLNDDGTLSISVNSTILQSYNASDHGKHSAVPRRLTLDANGNLAIYSWVANDESWVVVWRAISDGCNIRGVCGNGICSYPNISDLLQYNCNCPEGFSSVDPRVPSQGCRREVPLSCDQTLNSSFSIQMHQFRGVNYLGVATFQDQIASTDDCSNLCLQNCSCVCASYDTSGTQICWIHSDMLYGGLMDPNETYTFILKLASKVGLTAEVNNQLIAHHRSLSMGALTGIICSSSAVSAIFMLVIVIWNLSSRRKTALLRREWSLRLKTGLPIKFSYKELEAATQRFKEKIGSGGFGEVFKGVLPIDGSVVAVKKLQGSSSDQGGDDQFQAEVATIGSIHHANIVHLRGYCCEGSHRLLVYEFMENGSLNRLLFSSSSSSRPLEWELRYKIALGIAQGIAYFHEQCRNRIIHCDIKPENILLTKDFCPKVSDFGLAKLVSRSQTRIVTAVRGTRGYVAPEWVSNLPVTAKADVYSFGMLLLEMVSGRRNLDLSVSSEKLYYPYWAYQELAMQRQLGESLAKVVDPALLAQLQSGNNSHALTSQVIRGVLNVAFWCIQDEAASRPSMGSVVKMLEGSLQCEQAPLPNSILNLIREVEGDDDDAKALH